MPLPARALRSLYWRLPVAFRLFPLLILDALWGFAFGYQSLTWDTWPPILWPRDPDGHRDFLEPIIGGYMMVGAVLTIAGVTLALCRMGPARLHSTATYGLVAGLWMLWSSYTASLVLAVHAGFETSFAAAAPHMTLWFAESLFMGIVLLSAYFDPAYRYFDELAHNTTNRTRDLMESGR